jgi:hypothetical protein
MSDATSDKDREAILDARSDGVSIAAIARRFNMAEHEVRDILREEVARYSDGDFLREGWVLTIRGLEQIESKFRRKGLDELNEAAAMVAIRANERRASLTGAGQTTIHMMMTPAPAKRRLSIEDLIDRHKRLNNALGVQEDDATVERAILLVHSVEKPDSEGDEAPDS